MSDVPAQSLTFDFSATGVNQTLYADDPREFVSGNCIQAAVATYLDLPLDAVPHFLTFQVWTEALVMFLAGFCLKWDRKLNVTEPPFDRAIVAGTSPRGVKHVIVSMGDGTYWDPHPSRAGLTEVDEVWRFYADDRLAYAVPDHIRRVLSSFDDAAPASTS